MLFIAVVLFLNYLSLFGAEWSSMFFYHCSLEPMCLSSTWLTDLLHIKSHWSILGKMQGSVGQATIWYTVRPFRLLDYCYFVLAAVGKIKAMPCFSLRQLRDIVLCWFLWWHLFYVFTVVAFLEEMKEEFLWKVYH